MRSASLVQVLRRHLATAIVVAVAVCLLVTAVVALRPNTAKATAVVQLYEVAGGELGPNASTDPVDAQTEASSVTSAAVLERAAGSLRNTGQGELTASISVDAPEKSQTLSIHAEAGTADVAAARANAVAKAYLQLRGADARRLVKAAAARLKRLSAGAGENEPLSGAWNYLATERARLEQVNVVPGRVIDAAVPESSSRWSGLLIGAVAGAVLGIMAALGLCLLLERSSRKVLDARRLAEHTGSEVIDWTEPNESARWLLARLGESTSEVRVVLVSGDPDATAEVVSGVEQVTAERGQPCDIMEIFRAEDIDSGTTTSGLLRRSSKRLVLGWFDAELGGARLTYLQRQLGTRAAVVLAVTKTSDLRTCRTLAAEAQRAGNGDAARLVFVAAPTVLAGQRRAAAQTEDPARTAHARRPHDAEGQPGPDAQRPEPFVSTPAPGAGQEVFWS